MPPVETLAVAVGDLHVTPAGTLSVGLVAPMPKSPRGHASHHHHVSLHGGAHRERAAPVVDSAIPALFKKAVDERIAEVAGRTHLREADTLLLGDSHAYEARGFGPPPPPDTGVS